jgi:S-adenosylmethionine hydrolase
VAGWLSKGVEVSKFGEEITDFVRFAAPKPKKLNEKLTKGVILKADKFGNLITNIRPQDVPELFLDEPPEFKILVGKHEVTKMKKAYAQGTPGEVFGILGSMGYLEIATNRGAAARMLGADKGSDVGVLHFGAGLHCCVADGDSAQQSTNRRRVLCTGRYLAMRIRGGAQRQS